MSKVDDVLDRISELVDEQLAAGQDGVLSKVVAGPDLCPHCGREWHGLALTARMAHMYAWGSYDEGYRIAEDDTEVVCPGSEFIGPRAPTQYERKVAQGQENTSVGGVSIGFVVVNIATGETMPLLGSERGFPRSPNASGVAFVGPGGGGGGSVAQSSSRLQGEGVPGGGGRGGSFSSHYGGAAGVWAFGAPAAEPWQDTPPSYGISIGGSMRFDEDPRFADEVSFGTDGQPLGEWLAGNRVPHRGDDLYTNSEER